MYLQFHNLKQEPFRLTPDPRFLRLTDQHKSALTALSEGVIGRKGFMVATGPVGTGKTTLLNALLVILSKLYHSQNRKFASAFVVNPIVNRDEFLEYLLQEFEISCPSTTKPRRLLALHEHFLDTQRSGGTSVLIIDEAHLLSPDLLEEIRLLTNLDTYREKLLQVILSGQPELATLLLRPEMKALRQRIALIAQIRPLSLADTHAYITQRLRLAGLEGPIPFSVEAVNEIHRRTEGIPRLINVVCDSCLAISSALSKTTIQSDIVRAAVGSLTLPRDATDDVGTSPAGGNGGTISHLDLYAGTRSVIQESEQERL